ncbi:hypothetical protein BU692_10195 [Staphylococcus chromogenes]|uniref:hypothetical protein n=2 Tax=Staphylococcus chromogenes TaxID=46126 RepID=UPI000D19DCE4|nr:hypothetical protein [Staphylococcus chromogenes]PTG54696.1 hypothetical protein BU692_10195 [Staphylococcus chromogenes]TJY15704.1 hypothetical protein FCF12_06705 [Staphylococcus chromogenes]
MRDTFSNRLSVKESWYDGKLESTLNKTDKKHYRSLDIQDRRKLIQKFKNKEPFNIYDYENNVEDEFSKIEKTLKKRELDRLSYETKQSLSANGVGMFIDDFFTRLSSSVTNPSNTGQMFTYELINQNFTLIKLLDDSLKRNDQLIKQNEEIIKLLTKIVDKGDM